MNTSSSDPAESDPIAPPLVMIPVVGGEEFPVWRSMIEDYARTYPAVNIEQEIREMRRWALDNPTLRKTLRGMPRFINAWLSREQDRAGRLPFSGGSPNGHANGPHPTTQTRGDVLRVTK
jgi:hypothetical protein